jgi:dTDP-4-amino-4,6-dideoxygalactose transaminase
MAEFRFPLRKVRLPDARALAPFIARIDANGMYTNYGPLMEEFREQLAGHFGCGGDQLVVLANATVALTLALNAREVRRGAKCLVPSLTFLATPAAALSAGLDPFFMDIDPARWTSTPAEAEKALAAAGGPAEVAAVIPVSTYGAVPDMDAWRAFQDRTGVQVIVDGAWCFDNARAHALPQCISLHATKVFGTGEGGLVISADRDLIFNIRKRANFGILPDRRVLLPGINGKMSEYGAAIGLAGLGTWPGRRRETLALQSWYVEALARVPGVAIMPGFGAGWAGGTIAITTPIPAVHVAERLGARGIEARHWWGRPCHTQIAYAGFGRADLSATERLAEHIINLPFWVGLSRDDVAEIVQAVARAIGTAA